MAVPTFNCSEATAWMVYEAKFLATAVANKWVVAMEVKVSLA